MAERVDKIKIVRFKFFKSPFKNSNFSPLQPLTVAPLMQQGFTYMMLLAVVAVLGITSGVAVQYQSKISHREKEKELLFRGQAIMKAIQSYYVAGKTVKLYPPSLDALLHDNRFASKKHIRKLYIDPFTLKADWVVIKNQYGAGILGVHSRSNKHPLKQANFPVGLESFELASSYSDWHFVYQLTPKVPLINKNGVTK